MFVRGDTYESSACSGKTSKTLQPLRSSQTRKQQLTRRQPLLQMGVSGPSKRQLLTLCISGIVLFLFGFLIGYFTVPVSDDSENKSDTSSRTIEEQRKCQARKKEEYHSKLYQALNKSEIGKNVKYVNKITN